MRSSETATGRTVLRCRFVVVGSGIAGLWTALHLRDHGEVVLVTKSQLKESNTGYAQGGIAVALLPADSPELHKQDTLAAGDGMCDAPAVDILTREGPDAVRELIRIGARFDSREGQLIMGREAAHQIHRIIHAQGDATGAEVERAASEAVTADPNITILEHTAVTNLVLLQGKCAGIEALDAVSGERLRILAGSVMLATGGVGNLFRVTTNPPVATGDALAVAWRAGAALQDLEFVQFHPTALADPSFPKFLISEAVRGEGAVLRNAKGEAFMERYSPSQKDLAPRDEVSRAVLAEMREDGADHVYLDLSPIGDRRAIEKRFPGITAELRERGIWQEGSFTIPVTPAAHYMMGGIRSDVNGQSSIPGLYACGEAASCGVHGANRLASNSLLDGLVFGARSARAMVSAPDLTEAEADSAAALPQRPLALADPALRDWVQDLMWDRVGILRDGDGLDTAAAQLRTACQRLRRHVSGTYQEVETAAMIQAARLITEAALERTESRGAHCRTDFPASRPQWRRHIVLHRGEGGDIITHFSPVLD
jgi:L-aspartate oxidase